MKSRKRILSELKDAKWWQEFYSNKYRDAEQLNERLTHLLRRQNEMLNTYEDMKNA